MTIFESYSDVVTVSELAEMLKIGRNTAYELVRCGAIPSVKVGKSIRISKEAIIDYVNQSADQTIFIPKAVWLEQS